jgi:hypothetical protein
MSGERRVKIVSGAGNAVEIARQLVGRGVAIFGFAGESSAEDEPAPIGRLYTRS